MSEPTLAEVLAEVRQLDKRLASLTAAVRAKNVRPVKRTKTILADLPRRQPATIEPTAIEVAAAKRMIARKAMR